MELERLDLQAYRSILRTLALTPSMLTDGALQVHKLVIAENEAGAITRQEAVSMIPPLLLDVQPHHRVSQKCLTIEMESAPLHNGIALHDSDCPANAP